MDTQSLRASATEIDVTVTVRTRAQGKSKSSIQEGKQHRAKRVQKSSVQEGRQRRRVLLPFLYGDFVRTEGSVRTYPRARFYVTVTSISVADALREQRCVCESICNPLKLFTLLKATCRVSMILFSGDQRRCVTCATARPLCSPAHSPKLTWSLSWGHGRRQSVGFL